MLSFSWPAEGFKEEDFTLDFIYDLHGLVGIDGPNEFAKMLLEHDKELCKAFCLKWKEYNETEYWKTKE
jgi:hypothetical protein